MNTIIEQPIFVASALGKQAVNPDCKYRPINFLIFAESPDGYLAYNTLTKQMILTTPAEYKVLHGEAAVEPIRDKLLIEGYFLVPEGFDDNQCSRQLRDLFRLLDNGSSITSYVILPTTDCNARCFYCCENGQKRIMMTEQTALETAGYIEKNCGGAKVSIMWFGGEPLYNIEPINIISDYLKKAGIEFSSNMISNAYLFDEEVIKTGKQRWNLKSVQVTLDGTEEIYNKTKAYIYKNEISPFKKVINNIKLLAENEIKVIIRLNMDLFNKDNLYLLVDYLHDCFVGNKFINIYIRMLFDNTSKIQTERSNDERRKLYSEFTKFEEYIESKGMYHYQKLNSVYVESSCIGTNKHGTVIMPGGELGMCDLHTDSDLYGNINEGVTDKRVIDNFLVYKPPVKGCEKCPIYPNCRRLEKCLYYTRDCEEYEQERLIIQMRKYMQYTYKTHSEVK